VARAAGDVQQGYSPFHIRSAMLGSLFWGLWGLLLVYRMLRELFPASAAFWAAFLLLYATFLYWYLIFEPLMSHAGSFFCAALVLYIWWGGREDLEWRRAALLGLATGLAATVRWQNGVLLLLPAFTLLPRLRRDPRRSALLGAIVLVGFALGTLPQLLAWKAIFGSYLLQDPPHGADFLRLGNPYLLQTFFSSRHGLLYWTPILWAGFLGFVPLARRRPRLALALALPLVVMSYVNACSGDWWAGGSFSNRRFDSVLPLLALGLGASLEGLRLAVARRPGLLLVAAGALLTLWNFLFMQQYGENRIPRDDTVSFAQVTENNADILSDLVGTPLAWPANWIFAWRHDLPAQKYDLMVGPYLFYRQNNLGGVLDLGDDRIDPGLLGENWARRRPCGSGICRGLDGRARIFAPLDLPEELTLIVRAAGSGSLGVAVNGHELGALPLRTELADYRLRARAELWQRELNEIALDPGDVKDAVVEHTRFERRSR
jgi:hypothetical protein